MVRHQRAQIIHQMAITRGTSSRTRDQHLVLVSVERLRGSKISFASAHGDQKKTRSPLKSIMLLTYYAVVKYIYLLTFIIYNSTKGSLISLVMRINGPIPGGMRFSFQQKCKLFVRKPPSCNFTFPLRNDKRASQTCP